MATKIVTKNSSTAGAAPTATDLVQGELAVNVADGRLYTEDNAAAIVELGVNPATEITANAGIALPDSQKATFGASDDLQIYHDGSSSFIKDAGTGNLIIQATDLQIANADNTANYIRAFNGGAVDLRYAGSAKLATTSTGINVTGNMIADGVGIGTSSPYNNSKLDVAGSIISTSQTIGTYAADNAGFDFAAATKVGRFFSTSSNATGGHMTFITGAGGGNERMRIDSSGNVLVGTTTENVYDGTTSGVALTQSGYIFVGKSNDAPLYLNRIASDGVITNFAKDGTTVGSIGTQGSRLTIGNGDTGLRIAGDLNTIVPWNTTTNLLSDSAIDLGRSNQRFKDLYLSGVATIGTNGSEYANNYIRFKSGGAAFIDHLTVSQDINFRVSNASGLDKTPLTLKSDGVAYMPNGVYLGGTGAANKLDDYEEGTWTPVVNGGSGYGTTAHYTKVGRVVHFKYFSSSFTATAVAATISGLPFLAENGVSNYACFYTAHNTVAVNSTGGFIDIGGTALKFINNGTTTHATFNSGAGRYVMLAGSYTTAQ